MLLNFLIEGLHPIMMNATQSSGKPLKNGNCHWERPILHIYHFLFQAHIQVNSIFLEQCKLGNGCGRSRVLGFLSRG